jgi:hypothetical protein
MRLLSLTKKEMLHSETKNGTIMSDMRGIPTSACPLCGDKWLLVPVQFDDDTYEVAVYGTDASCYSCGVAITAPTPLDHPDYEDNYESYSW